MSEFPPVGQPLHDDAIRELYAAAAAVARRASSDESIRDEAIQSAVIKVFMLHERGYGDARKLLPRAVRWAISDAAAARQASRPTKAGEGQITDPHGEGAIHARWLIRRLINEAEFTRLEYQLFVRVHLGFERPSEVAAHLGIEVPEATRALARAREKIFVPIGATEGERAAAALCFLAGTSNVQAAELLGTSPNGIAQRLVAVRAKLAAWRSKHDC